MARSIISLLGCSFLIACATPQFPESSKTNNGTEKGPGIDLAGFVTQSPDDLSQSVASDMAKSPTTSDMASAAKDMATQPPDMATASGCGAVTYNGICSGDNLIYCDAGTLVTIDCWINYSSSCEVIGGVADCYF